MEITPVLPTDTVVPRTPRFTSAMDDVDGPPLPLYLPQLFWTASSNNSAGKARHHYRADEKQLPRQQTTARRAADHH
jgi:hypothetical protein